MAFLNPFLLLGMLTVSIPIIIHLLNRRKFDRIAWAAMRFLRISVEQNQRRMRIEDLILLLLRCLLLAMLAFALARPALRAATTSPIFGQSSTTAVLVLDNSASMGQTNGVTTRMDLARKALQQSIDSMPPGSSAALFLASDVTDPAIPQPTLDMSLVGRTIQNAPLTDRPTNLFGSISSALEMLDKAAAVRKEIYIATDGQLLGFQQLPDIVKALDAVKDKIHVHFFLCDQPESYNLSVSDLRLGGDIPAAGHVIPVNAEVTNWGHEDVHNLRVTLHLDDQPPSAEAIVDHLAPGASAGVTMLAKAPDAAHHTITVSVPPDHLTSDDSRMLAFQGIAKVNVLLVDGNPGTEARDSEVFFLRHAMIPVARAQADDYFVKCTTILPSDLPSAKLDDYQVVVLADVSEVTDKTTTDLSAFVTAGGGLLIFPGDNLRPTVYNDRLGAAGLLAAGFGMTQGSGLADGPSMHLERRGDHPIASIFDDPQSGDLTVAHFYRRYELTAPPASANKAAPRTVLSFDDKKPFMIERALGRGRIVQFASTASTRWNDLADHAGLWVPLIYRTLAWIVLENQSELNVHVGDRLILHPPREQLGEAVVVTMPGQQGNAPRRESRQVQMDANSQPIVTFENTNLAGEYDLAIGEQPPVKFAAQMDKTESDLQSISAAQRQQLAAVADVVDFKPGMDLSGQLTRQEVGTEIWRPFAILALVLALGETLLADWFSQPK